MLKHRRNVEAEILELYWKKVQCELGLENIEEPVLVWL